MVTGVAERLNAMMNAIDGSTERAFREVIENIEDCEEVFVESPE
jgi:hypothetical protein